MLYFPVAQNTRYLDRDCVSCWYLNDRNGNYVRRLVWEGILADEDDVDWREGGNWTWRLSKPRRSKPLKWRTTFDQLYHLKNVYRWDQIGSVRIFTPSICTKKLACPSLHQQSFREHLPSSLYPILWRISNPLPSHLSLLQDFDKELTLRRNFRRFFIPMLANIQ
jgi:hypothetical protein